MGSSPLPTEMPTTINDERQTQATFQPPVVVAKDVETVFAGLPRAAKSADGPRSTFGFPDELGIIRMTAEPLEQSSQGTTTPEDS